LDRLPTNQGFDEWFGIRAPTTSPLDGQNDSKGLWPAVGDAQGWNPKADPPQPIYEARKGEQPKVLRTLDLEQRRLMEGEITRRGIDFMTRQVKAGRPFFAYLSFSLMHFPTLPGPEFAGKTGNGEGDSWRKWTTSVGQVLDG
jgi:arylsulfatase